jgi:nucleotide-binding universal stress UspA family protein
MEKLTILIPTNFSDLSLEALKMASLLSAKFEVKLHVLHVIEANTLVLNGDPEFSEEVDLSFYHQEIENSKTNFKKLKDSGINFEEHLSIGLITSEIKKSSIFLNADLVITGVNEHHNFLNKISSSEAQQLVRHLGVPVLSVKKDTPLDKQFSHILLAADYEYFGKGVQINLIKTIAEAFSSTIHLLQILKEDDENQLDVIEAQMEFFASMHQLKNYQIHLYRDLEVTQGIRNFNKEVEMDLVCIRTHGRKGIAHLMYGSIAEKLVNNCKKPVLTFHLKDI